MDKLDAIEYLNQSKYFFSIQNYTGKTLIEEYKGHPMSEFLQLGK